MVTDGARRARQIAGPMAMLTVEALERLATPEIAAKLLNDALGAAQLEAVPEDRPRFGNFATGALNIVVREALGEESAEAVMNDLEPALLEGNREAGSGIRKRGRESLTQPKAHDRVVLMASSDRTLVDRLLPSFDERTKVVAAYDMFGLLQSSQRYIDHPMILILHDEMESIRPSSLATLARVMPPTTTVLQFGKRGAEPERQGDLPDLRWIRLGDVAAHEVLEACAALMQPEIAMPEPAPGRKIVVAHACSTQRGELAARLRHAGHEVVEADDGIRALERCLKDDPEMIFVQSDLPDLDGLQLAVVLEMRLGDLAPPVHLLSKDGESESGLPGVIESDIDAVLAIAAG